jgi:hypothetical protein
MKQLFILILLSVSFLNTKGQSLGWEETFTTQKMNYIFGLNLDYNGNVYASGKYWPGQSGKPGLFRFKIDPYGTLLWSDTTDLYGIDFTSMSGRPDGTCYISVTNHTSFTIGDSTVNYGSYYGWECSVLMEQDTAGDILWTRFLPRIEIHSVSVNSDFVYACGKVNSSSVISGHTVLPGGCILKYDFDGNLVSYIYSGFSNEKIIKSTLDSLGNLYVLFEQSWTQAEFLAKYGSNDSLIWRQTASGFTESINSAPDGTLYIIIPSNLVQILPDGSPGWTYSYTYPSTTASKLYIDPIANKAYGVAINTDSKSYIVEHDLTDGTPLKYTHIPLPLGITKLLNSYNQIDSNGDLIIAGEFSNDYRPLGIFKFSLDSSATSVPEKVLSVLTVYPNPSSCEFTLEFESSDAITVLNVYNQEGKKIQSRKLSVAKGRRTERIDLSAQSSGVYTIEVVAGKERFSRTVVKQ